MSDKVLILDYGTSALKAVLFSADGRILAQADGAYPPASSLHRQSPEGWWQAAAGALTKLDLAGVGAVGLTGTMENLVPLDADKQPIGEALLYSDPCGEPYFAMLTEAQKEAADAICGNGAEPLMSAFKLAFLRAEQPETCARIAHLLFGPKDYMLLRLTGQLATDAANAATTGLMGLLSRQWSDDLLALHRVERAWLPPILPGDAIVGLLRPDAAEALGLVPGIPVINGCGDGAATTLGGGVAAADDVSLYLGTSGWVARLAHVDAEPRPFYRLPHPAIAGTVIEIAPILSAGAAAQWARATLGLDMAQAEDLALQADAAPGTALFLPYLSGERSPFVDLDLRGGFVGLDAGQGAGALYHAVLEGVGLSIAGNLEAMGGVVGAVGLVGGGAQSRLWPQLLADIIGHAISVPAHPVAASSLGAFRLVAQALGLSLAAEQQARHYTPRPDRAPRLERQRQRFVAATAFLRSLA